MPVVVGVRDSALDYVLDGQRHVTPIATLRGDVALRARYASPAEEAADRARFAAAPNKYKDDAANGLRPWSREDVAPRPGDVWQERLYCIQWQRPDGTVFFAGAGPDDEARELAVRAAVEQNLAGWQRAGLVPDMPIEPGQETTRLFRERGWTHWHHLFTPRQLHQIALWQRHSRAHEQAAALALDVARLTGRGPPVSSTARTRMVCCGRGGRPRRLGAPALPLHSTSRASILLIGGRRLFAESPTRGMRFSNSATFLPQSPKDFRGFQPGW
jgi:hypothetical protein